MITTLFQKGQRQKRSMYLRIYCMGGEIIQCRLCTEKLYCLNCWKLDEIDQIQGIIA